MTKPPEQDEQDETPAPLERTRLEDVLDRLADNCDAMLAEARERREREHVDPVEALYGAAPGSLRRASLEAKRRPLKRVTFPRLIAAYVAKGGSIPDGELTRIPDGVWSQDEDGAAIACPCGQTPVAESGLPVQCDCGRVFYFSGEYVIVANSPVRGLATKPVPPAEAESLTEIEPSALPQA